MAGFLIAWNVVWVLLALVALAVAAAAVGCFAVWMKIGLGADVAAHGSLPGLLAGLWIGVSSDSMALLLLTGVAGAAGALLLLLLLQRFTTTDAAMAVSLSIAFGAGLAVLSVLQHQATVMVPGIGQLFYGFAAGMPRHEALWFIAVALGVVAGLWPMMPRLVSLIHNPQIAQLNRDDNPLLRLVFGIALLLLIAASVRAVGVVMVVGFLLFPTAIARCWFPHWRQQLYAAMSVAVLVTGPAVCLSAVLPDLPTGALVVALYVLALGLSLFRLRREVA